VKPPCILAPPIQWVGGAFVAIAGSTDDAAAAGARLTFRCGKQQRLVVLIGAASGALPLVHHPMPARGAALAAPAFAHSFSR
jgi:hypothetical protein